MADHTVNFCTGCSHDCRYCYAKGMAIQYNRLTADEWPIEKIRDHDVVRKQKRYDGRVMTPSSHDITPGNLQAGITVIGKLLDAGNHILIVSKPHLDCIRVICDAFYDYRELFDVNDSECRQDRESLDGDCDLFEVDENGQRHYRLTFRFSIGACDDRLLSFWEPGAPSYSERKAALKLAYDRGFQTGISIEPMIDATNIDVLIADVSPYVTDSIWIGKMNHIGRFGKNAGRSLRKAIQDIKHGQTDSMIRSIYQRHRNNPLIRWKDSIRKVIAKGIRSSITGETGWGNRHDRRLLHFYFNVRVCNW